MISTENNTLHSTKTENLEFSYSYIHCVYPFILGLSTINIIMYTIQCTQWCKRVSDTWKNTTEFPSRNEHTRNSLLQFSIGFILFESIYSPITKSNSMDLPTKKTTKKNTRTKCAYVLRTLIFYVYIFSPLFSSICFHKILFCYPLSS